MGRVHVISDEGNLHVFISHRLREAMRQPKKGNAVQPASLNRSTPGAAGFLTFSHAFDLPDR
jgi:hypothetical protein